MSEKRVWICDGCDLEKDVTSSTGDWKMFAVTASGFKGYPTCASEDPVNIGGNLCPTCASRYYEQLRPRLWPRIAPPAPSQAETEK